MVNDYWRGAFLAFCTAFLWGGMSPTAKIIASAGLSQITVVSYRAVFIVAVAGSWLFFTGGSEKFALSRRMLRMYFMLGFFTVVLNATGFMMSCSYLSVPKTLILHYTFPLVTMAGAALITKERPSWIQVLAGVLVLAGLYVGFILGKSDESGISAAGVIWGILSVVGLSGQTLLSRTMGIQEKSDPILQLFYSYLFGGALLVLLNSLFGGWSDIEVMTPKLFLILQYPAALAGLVGFGCLFSSLKYIPPSTASLICTLEIVFALTIAYFLLDQAPSTYELAGCVIVMASVGASIFFRKKES
ncbi:MAG: DMT family transporter [Synergistaceae bacterium]|nr:DMT family transporter [Synergistaceae bacterium]